jgi:hypothetical protein
MPVNTTNLSKEKKNYIYIYIYTDIYCIISPLGESNSHIEKSISEARHTNLIFYF